MHEFSIAEAIIEQVLHHAPDGMHVRSVTIEAGPMRGIEPQAMQWAWQAATGGTRLDGSKLLLKQLPWTLRCPQCDALFEADQMFEPCACGCVTTKPHDCDRLMLMSMDVDERSHSHAGSHR